MILDLNKEIIRCFTDINEGVEAVDKLQQSGQIDAANEARANHALFLLHLRLIALACLSVAPSIQAASEQKLMQIIKGQHN